MHETKQTQSIKPLISLFMGDKRFLYVKRVYPIATTAALPSIPFRGLQYLNHENALPAGADDDSVAEYRGRGLNRPVYLESIDDFPGQASD